MATRLIALMLAGMVIVSAGCNRSVTPFQPTPDNQTIITEILTGTVPVPVDDVLQSTFRTYTVGQGGGPVTVTLTSAVQTQPDGSLQTGVIVGLGAGSVAGGACVVPANSYVATPPGTLPQLSGSLAEGTYCIRVSGVTGQAGSVAFSITLTHP